MRTVIIKLQIEDECDKCLYHELVDGKFNMPFCSLFNAPLMRVDHQTSRNPQCLTAEELATSMGPH